MMLIVLVTAGALFEIYFRRGPARPRESLGVGLLWFTMNIVMDYPMFGFWASRLAGPRPL
jgi:hypothetical protein